MTKALMFFFNFPAQDVHQQALGRNKKCHYVHDGYFDFFQFRLKSE